MGAAGTVAICGGNNGQMIQDKFFLMSFKQRHGIMQEPQVTEMPSMIHAREEFALVMGPDHKLYAIGGYNQQEYPMISLTFAEAVSPLWKPSTSNDSSGPKSPPWKTAFEP
jgi:hypothetical protein